MAVARPMTPAITTPPSAPARVNQATVLLAAAADAARPICASVVIEASLSVALMFLVVVAWLTGQTLRTRVTTNRKLSC
jgi:hypothetical protein